MFGRENRLHESATDSKTGSTNLDFDILIVARKRVSSASSFSSSSDDTMPMECNVPISCALVRDRKQAASITCSFEEDLSPRMPERNPDTNVYGRILVKEATKDLPVVSVEEFDKNPSTDVMKHDSESHGKFFPIHKLMQTSQSARKVHHTLQLPIGSCESSIQSDSQGGTPLNNYNNDSLHRQRNGSFNDALLNIYL